MDSKSEKLYLDLLEEGFNISNDWFKACNNFVKDNFKGDICNLNDIVLRKEIIEQFILADISETSIPVIRDLSDIRLVRTDKNIVLQANSYVSISESFYSQLNNVMSIKYISVKNKTKTDDVKINDSVYLLELTDGFTKIKGITLSQTNWINNKIMPGFKILIKKGCDIRRGVFMLNSINYEYQGGFSENLVENNNEKQNLQEKLGISSHKHTHSHPLTSTNHVLNKKIENVSERLISSIENIGYSQPAVNTVNQNMMKEKIYKNESTPYKKEKKTTCTTDYNLSEDSFDDFIQNIDEEKINKVYDDNSTRKIAHSTKPPVKYKSLDFKPIPKSISRPFLYLNEINSDFYDPFMCRCMILKVLSPLCFCKDGSCSMQIQIDDGIISVEAFISNTLFFGPPFLASKSLIIKYLEKNEIAIQQLNIIIEMLHEEISNSSHCLLLRKVMSLGHLRPDAFEILAIYSIFPDEYIEYLNYQLFALHD